MAKPFFKWVGGKRQLIKQLSKALPSALDEREFTYVEPFGGGGAFLFWMLRRFPNLKRAIINDINTDLINSYKVLQNTPNELISTLKELQDVYLSFSDNMDKQEDFFIQMRSVYNQRIKSDLFQAALFIFLNKTCYNGVYRVNQKNEFNGSFGKHSKPSICDKNTLWSAHRALQKVEIINLDFQKTLHYVDSSSLNFFYLDPPYKPVGNTTHFRGYTKRPFNDNEQKRVFQFCQELNDRNILWLQSNSNPLDNDFFDTLYKGCSVSKIKAKRTICSFVESRKIVSELVITNYPHSLPVQLSLDI